MTVIKVKKNPQDTTLRNLRALKKALAALNERLKVIERKCKG